MKNLRVHIRICTFWFAIATGSLQAHIFTFRNHTNMPVDIGIQLLGLWEPFYYATIPAQESTVVPEHQFRFVAGEGDPDVARKFE